MYAVAHVSGALAVKKRFPTAPLFGLMVAVQGSELLWMLLSYLGIEHQMVDRFGVMHLDFLAYSHSVASGIALGVLGWAIFALYLDRPKLGLAFGLALASHVALDIVQHEPNIQLAPGVYGPLLGLGLARVPALDFLVETSMSVACWYYFGGSKKLLAALIALNLTNLPLMFAPAGSAYPLAANHLILPSVILAQTLMAWALVYAFGRKRANQIGEQTEASTGRHDLSVAEAI
ncbi:MAG: hypothetical protein M3170_03000 [Candidatus Dormibacteraeota bacterium]|nr:hypothetical protein [Candidatus Dormibacteraeota bacterium]